MANIKLSSLKSVRYAIETEAQFATVLSGTSTFRTLRVANCDIDKSTAMLANETAVQYIDQYREMEPGLENAVVTMDGPLYGAPVALTSGATAGRHDLAEVLGVSTGYYSVTSGSAVVSATTSASFAVTAGQGVRFPNGGVVGLMISGVLETSPVLSKSTDTLHLGWTLPAVPSASLAVYNAHIVAFADPTGSVQIQRQGHDRADNWYAGGCMGGFGLEVALGEIAKWSAEVQGPLFYTGSRNEVLSVENYTTSNTVQFTNSRLFLKPLVSGSVHQSQCLKFTTIGLSFNPTFQDVRTACGVQTVADKVRVRTPDDFSTIDLETYYIADESLSSEWFTALTNKTLYSMWLQIGSQPTETAVLNAATVQIVKAVQADRDGLEGVSLSLKVLEDRRTNIQSGENEALCRSPIKLYFL